MHATDDKIVADRLESLGAVFVDNVWRMGSVQIRFEGSPGWAVYLVNHAGEPLRLASYPTLGKALVALEEQICVWVGVLRTYGRGAFI